MKTNILKSIILSLMGVFFVADYVAAKNVVICFDGTGNHPDQAEEKRQDTTNVHRICDALIEDDDQVVKYLKGVGTSGWKIWDLKGDLYGLGAKDVREEAQKYLLTKYKSGDKLFIFGFSRGAAIARDFANGINDEGTGQIRTVPIELLGLWDTVAAFGIPMDVFGIPTGSINLGKKLDVPSNVKKTYHLLAIDEKRKPFIPTLVEAGSKVEEVWFAGVHTDVGGGYKSRKLADITLRFMIERSKLHSLRFDQDKLDNIPENSSGEGEILDNLGKFPVQVRKIVVRQNNNSSGAKPKIHKTVFARMKNQEYEPENFIGPDGNYEMVE